jgi:DNA-binding phage protein
VDDGVPLREALADIIRGIGGKGFAEKVGMSSPNVVRAIDPARNPTEETLERLLEPFKLRLGLAFVGRRKRQRRRPPRRPP